VQEKQKVVLQELIERVNDLFKGDLSSNDKLVYVNDAIKGKLLEDYELLEQSISNTEEQFNASPDLDRRLEDAIIVAMGAFDLMSRQALEPGARSELKSLLLGPARLYEALRARAMSLGMGAGRTG
jgi:type I restriction enzyme R subunit